MGTKRPKSLVIRKFWIFYPCIPPPRLIRFTLCSWAHTKTLLFAPPLGKILDTGQILIKYDVLKEKNLFPDYTKNKLKIVIKHYNLCHKFYPINKKQNVLA